jgi:hypothetical protein
MIINRGFGPTSNKKEKIMFTLEEAHKAIARLEHYIQLKLSKDEMEHVLCILVNTTFPSCNPVDLVQFMDD